MVLSIGMFWCAAYCLAFDGVLKVQPAESERRGHDRDIARPQAVHGFLVGIEADESLVFWNVNEVWFSLILLFNTVFNIFLLTFL